MSPSITTEIPRAKPTKIPPLESGDELSRDEFERRYDAMPDLKKAELIEGVVYVSSPVRAETHGNQQFQLVGALAVYAAFTPHVHGSDNATVRLDLDNEPQPDQVLYIAPEKGGAVRIEDGYIVGAPELASEISSSSTSMDLGKKFHVYRRNGVREYLVWRVLDNAIDWFVLEGAEFRPLAADAQGIYRSRQFPGLWPHAAALIAGDLPLVHRTLQEGLQSAEHVTFIEEVQRK